MSTKTPSDQLYSLLREQRVAEQVISLIEGLLTSADKTIDFTIEALEGDIGFYLESVRGIRAKEKDAADWSDEYRRGLVDAFKYAVEMNRSNLELLNDHVLWAKDLEVIISRRRSVLAMRTKKTKPELTIVADNTKEVKDPAG